MDYDIRHCEDCIEKSVTREIRQNEYDAIVSFIFNLGTGNFTRSTLLKLINENAPIPAIQREFKKWVHAGGRVLPGLVRRRNAEAELYGR